MTLPTCPECGQELRPGATGKYPEGKLNPDDQGELRAALGVVDGRVVIDFGKPVPWIAMTPEEAINFGAKIVEHASGGVLTIVVTTNQSRGS